MSKGVGIDVTSQITLYGKINEEEDTITFEDTAEGEYLNRCESWVYRYKGVLRYSDGATMEMELDGHNWTPYFREAEAGSKKDTCIRQLTFRGASDFYTSDIRRMTIFYKRCKKAWRIHTGKEPPLEKNS